MAELNEGLFPVIIGVGEFIQRGDDSAPLEPVDLMCKAMRAAEVDAGVEVLASIDQIDLVGQVTWRYRDPIDLLCNRLGISPAHQNNASMGGETPIRLIHEAAIRISNGEREVCAIVGGEALSSLRKARKAKLVLDWTPLVPREEAVKVDSEKLPLSKAAQRAGAVDPIHIYPLYENAFNHALGLNPGEGRASAASLWAQYAAVAAKNGNAWIKSAPTAEDIATVSAANPPVCFPYNKLNVANPSVNQAAATIVASREWALRAGIPEENLVYVWGGASAQEPEDFLLRDQYARSSAQVAVLEASANLIGGAEAFDLVELYSCFPVVPKMALSSVQFRDGVTPTVTGGLTFFGGPLNNYMSHATSAMVQALRRGEGSFGLLYGQGGVVTKHHGLVLGVRQPRELPSSHYDVQERADHSRGAVPELVESYTGRAILETYTVVYARDMEPLHGIAIVRVPGGGRTIARVRSDDVLSMSVLLDEMTSPIGCSGTLRLDSFGQKIWEAGAVRPSVGLNPRYCTVERDGKVTIVTMNRPDAMNALHPLINEELDEIFNWFEGDPDQWVAILTGSGERAFSSGNDLKHTAMAMRRGEQVLPPRNGFAGLTARWDMTKPVIAAVNGIAMGGGFEIALACDLIVASENAQFALPEPKVGLAALAGGLLRLPRQIGLKQAMGMILTGRRIDAQEALRLGLVNEVVPLADLLPAAMRWAEQILECSPMSIRASKEAVTRGLEETVESAYLSQMRNQQMRALFRSSDPVEGPRAFAEKRKPRWAEPLKSRT